MQLTLGPGGRNVIIDSFDSSNHNALAALPEPQITKDGVTVAKSINMLADPVQSLGCKLLIDAAERTNEESGDGTTTCTVIANAIIAGGQKYLMSTPSSNLSDFRQGLRAAVEAVLVELD